MSFSRWLTRRVPQQFAARGAGRGAGRGTGAKLMLERLEDRTVPSALHASLTSLVAAPATSTFGQPVALTATVSGKAGTPTGTVFFVEGGSTFLGSGTLSGGAATIDTTALPAGSDSLTAVYLGDGVIYSGSTSTAVLCNVGANVLSTTSLTFGNVAVGTSSALTVSLTDPTSSTTLTSLAITGPDAADFTVASGPILPFPLSSSPLTYTVTYQPSLSNAGPESATLTFVTSAGSQAGSQTVALSGTGVAVPKAPTASAGGPYFMDPGTSLTLDASASVATDANDDNLSYSWNINGHKDVATGVEPTLSWSQLTSVGIGLASDGSAGFFNNAISVVVTDDHGNSTTSSSVSLLVSNPSAGIHATPGFPTTIANGNVSVSATVGEATSVTLTTDDVVPANQAAPDTYDVNWGDGSPDTIVSGLSGVTTATHVYTTTGVQAVSVTTTDKQGAVSAPALLDGGIDIINPILLTPFADLMTTPNDVLTGALDVGPNHPVASQSYQFDLVQGDFLAIAVGPDTKAPSPLNAATLVVTDPDGTTQQKSSSGPGFFDSDPILGFTAPETGTYTLVLTNDSVTTKTDLGLGYLLDLHRLALAQGPQNTATLAQSGDMYAFLIGNQLFITGPTGYGFSITGNWTQTVTGSSGATLANASVGSTYTATGNLMVNTEVGQVPMSIPFGESFIVKTEPNIFGREFGQVSSIETGLSFSVASYLTKYTNALAEFGLNVNSFTVLNAGWSIMLGSQINQQQKIGQVLGGVPYLFYDAEAGLSATFGTISIEYPEIPSLSAVIIVDPSDPSLYLSFSFNPGFGKAPLDLPITQLAFSPNGRIPYVPTYAPTAGSGLTVTSTVQNGALASVAIAAAGSGYPLNSTFTATVNQPGASGGVIDVTTNDLGVPTSVALTGATGTGYTAETGVPTTPLTQEVTQLFGQVYISGSVPLTIPGLPLSVSGDVTMNLDVNNTGQFLDGAANAGLLYSGDLLEAKTVLPDIDIGVNGTLNLGYSGGGFDFTVPLGGASAVYNGPLGGVWFRTVGGGNPLAGTPLSSLAYSNTNSVQGAVFTSGQFFLSLTDSLAVGPGTIGFTLNLDNSSITAEGFGSLKAEVNSNNYASFTLTAVLSASFISGKDVWSGSATASGKAVSFGHTQFDFSVSATVDNNDLVFDFGSAKILGKTIEFGATIPLP